MVERLMLRLRIWWVGLVLRSGRLPRGWHAIPDGHHRVAYVAGQGSVVKFRDGSWRLVSPDGLIVQRDANWASLVLYAAAVLRVGVV